MGDGGVDRLQDRLGGADLNEWIKKAEPDSGKPGFASNMAARLKALE